MLIRFRHHQQRSRRRTRDRGQASLEWLAIVALVAGLLALGAGLAQADAVGRRVTREMARALCLVRDGDCRRDQEPCVLDGDGTRSRVDGGVLIFRLSENRYALVERRSDGTYAVTIDQEVSGGVSVQWGLQGKAHAGSLGISAGGAVTAAILARSAHARTWIAGSEDEAQAILKSGGYLRPPDITSGGSGWASNAGASAGIDVGSYNVEAGSAKLEFDQRAGTTTDHRTGRRTTYVTADDKASAEALVLGSVESGGGDVQEVYAIETSATGRPLALTITATGALARSRDLPALVQPIAGRLAAPGANRYEITAALDLTEPAALAAAKSLLDAIAHQQGRAQPSATLRRLVESGGTVEARILAAHDETQFSAGAGATVGGAMLSLDVAIEKTKRRLLAAASRGLDGNWISREDCLR